MPSTSRASRRTSALATLAGGALVASSLALLSSAPAHAADPVDINILATNDFHGRIANNAFGSEAGAAVLAGAVDELRGTYPNTVFSAAGDLIGASTFESFIAHDKPTIDALNAAGLEVSAVGNHEFDQGYADLINRVMAPYDADTNPFGGAEWQYIGANVRMKADDSPALEPSWIKDFGTVQVGFVGAVTEHLNELVSPAGIADITVTDIVEETNTEAAALRAEGADLVVLLVHEGAPSTDCAAMDDDPTSDFGSIVTGVDENVDAIVSGHTHLAYNCSFPVAEWADRAVTERPVVSAGQYGTKLNQLVFSVDPDTGEVTGLTTGILDLKTEGTANYPADAEVQAIVDAAVAEADVLGAEPLGEIGGAFNRARRSGLDQDGNPTLVENRGGESTLGNLVAEAQRWATESETTGSAQIAFMNPGGLRANMVGNNAEGYPAVLTYKQAATVQPFANTLINMDLTGAQIRQALEEQWQPEGSSRPFLRLGTSDGFRHTYDPTAAAGEHVTGMWLNGEKVRMGQTYSVTVNSFLAAGGDNFGTFAEGTSRQDTGQTDLQGMVDYMDAFGSDDVVDVDYRQHAVGLHWRSDRIVEPGSRKVKVDVSSWAFTGDGDVQDSLIIAKLGKKTLGTFLVDNLLVAPDDAANPFDETGTARVVVKVKGVEPGKYTLRLIGDMTGSKVELPIRVKR